jgi:hypothetical protein
MINEKIYSLQLTWHITTNDTWRMGIARSISTYYFEKYLDCWLYYTHQVLAWPEKNKTGTGNVIITGLEQG